MSHPLAVVSTEAVVGREDECDIVLESGRVSRRHARVWSQDGRFGIEDLGSLNGTYVNRQRVVGSREIADGDRVTLADVELQFRAVPAETVARLPRRTSPVESRRPRGATEPMPPPYPVITPAYAYAPEAPPAGLAQDLSIGPIVVMVLASLAGAAAGEAVGVGQWGALALAVVTPLVVGAVMLSTDGRPRIASVVVLTLVAAVLTVTGVTAAELRMGRPIMPWASSGGTFASATQIDRLLGRAGLPAGCGTRPTVTLTPSRGSKTVPIQVSGHCFKAGEMVDLDFEGSTLASIRADDNGIVSTALALRPDADCPAGECVLVARGAQSLREQVARYLVTSSR